MPAADAPQPVPLPDYYVALLYKRLMGPTVLNVSSDAPAVRVYAHCLPSQAVLQAGASRAGVRGWHTGVSLAFVHLDTQANVTLALPPVGRRPHATKPN